LHLVENTFGQITCRPDEFCRSEELSVKQTFQSNENLSIKASGQMTFSFFSAKLSFVKFFFGKMIFRFLKGVVLNGDDFFHQMVKWCFGEMNHMECLLPKIWVRQKIYEVSEVFVEREKQNFLK
jgi:hypothetical protein